MEMKTALTFACMNLKKLAKTLQKREEKQRLVGSYFNRILYFIKAQRKTALGYHPSAALSTV